MGENGANRVRLSFTGTSLVETPFWVAFVLLPLIAYKDLHASPWHIAAIYSIKPIAALFSPYWSCLINGRPDRIVSNIVWARILSHLPFFFFPWVNSPLYFIAACGIYMLFKRAVIPAWMEALRLNLPADGRQTLFSRVSSLRYIGDAIVPFALGPLLDSSHEAWRWIFPALSLLSLSALPLQLRLWIPSTSPVQVTLPPLSLLAPWKAAWQLLKQRPDFQRFQVGFMLGGSGLMMMLPAIPALFVDDLALSYTEMAVALSACKGIGFVVATPLWARLMNTIDIFRLTSLVTLLAALFPLFLFFAQVEMSWLYVGFICYGMMQGGSELSWNLSGPSFSQDRDSSLFSSINVAAVGVRGCIASPLGSALLLAGTPLFALSAGGVFCLAATLLLAIPRKRSVSLEVTN